MSAQKMLHELFVWFVWSVGFSAGLQLVFAWAVWRYHGRPVSFHVVTADGSLLFFSATLLFTTLGRYGLPLAAQWNPGTSAKGALFALFFCLILASSLGIYGSMINRLCNRVPPTSESLINTSIATACSALASTAYGVGLIIAYVGAGLHG